MGRRPSQPRPESDSEPIGFGDADIGQSLRRDRAAGAGDNRPAAELDSALAADEAATEPSSSIADSAGSAAGKPKARGRTPGARRLKQPPNPRLFLSRHLDPCWTGQVCPSPEATIQTIDPTQVVEAEGVPGNGHADAPATPTAAAP